MKFLLMVFMCPESLCEDPISYGNNSTSNYIQSTRIPIDDIISFIREIYDHIDSMDIVMSLASSKSSLVWNELKYNCDEILYYFFCFAAD